MTASPIPVAPTLLREAEAARHLNVSSRTLERWRSTGRGPRFVKLAGGRHIRYALPDLAAWIDAQRRASLADPGPARAEFPA